MSIKMITCIIRPEKLESVSDALDKQHLTTGMMVTEVRGFGRQKGQVEHYRGGAYTIRFIPKVRIDVVVQEKDVDAIMATIEKVARTGNIGDGKLFVTDVSNVLRIRTGEKGTSAL